MVSILVSQWLPQPALELYVKARHVNGFNYVTEWHLKHRQWGIDQVEVAHNADSFESFGVLCNGTNFQKPISAPGPGYIDVYIMLVPKISILEFAQMHCTVTKREKTKKKL